MSFRKRYYRGKNMTDHIKKTLILSFCIVLLLALSSINTRAAAPSITTSAANPIEQVSATLNGSVNANNESTVVTFEYNTSGDFGGESPITTVTADQSPVTGSVLTPVSKAISGLTAGTRYYFRAVGVNGSDTVHGSTLDFVTDAAATAVTDAASSITNSGATLNGTVNALAESTTVTFEYGTTLSYGSSTAASPSPVTGNSDTAVSAVLGSLPSNTLYNYRVIATNSSGTVTGSNMTFYTSTPAAPTAVTDYATYNGVGQPNTANLKGTVNANNDSTTVTFQYGLTTSYGTTVTADESPLNGTNDTGVSKFISGLTVDTTYHYRVVATNGINTAYGADMTFYNTVAPYARTETVTNIVNDGATLNGVVNPKRFDDSYDTTVKFEYGLTNAYGSEVTPTVSPLSAGVEQFISQDISGLTANTTYHYRIVAESPTGTGTGDDMTFTTSSLPIVTTLGASPVGATNATFNGTVNANDDSTNVSFEYGQTDSYGTTVTATPSSVTGTTDTAVSRAIPGLTPNTTYHFRVVGTNSSGTSSGADQTFTTGISPPTVTTNGASAVSGTTANLNGTINANDNNTTVSFEYGTTTAYGKTASGTPGSVNGSTNTAVAAGISNLTPGTTYHYRAKGINAGGTIYGADMTFTTTVPPTVTTGAPSGLNTTEATLNGTVNDNGQSTTVTFQYGTTTAYGTTTTADESPVETGVDTAVSKSISSLTPGTTYHFRVVGNSINGISNGADMTFFTAAPAAPTTTTDAATSVTSGGAVLNGTVDANNDSTTVTFEYGTTNAYGTTVTADQSPLTGTIATAVTKGISGLSNNTTYHFRVVGQNGSGTSNGADMTFTTNALTPSAITGPATNVLYTSATLNGTANGNLAGATVTFEYGLTVAYGSSVTATPSSVPGDSTDYAVSADLTSLTPGTTYHFRAVVDNIFVSPQTGADMTFTTPIGPDATTDAATSVGSTTATVNGTVNAQNADATITFEYGIDTNYGQIVNATPNPVTGNTPTAVSAPLATLIPLTTYHFRVVAQNANGTAYGADDTFTTLGQIPDATTGAATNVGESTATLNGTVHSQNDATTVTFQYGTTTGYGTDIAATQSPLTAGSSPVAVSLPITGLTSGLTYHFRIMAVNTTGTTYSGDMTFVAGLNPPTATTNAASSITDTNATLNGIVNANGSVTTIIFEYGVDTNYGKVATADQSPLSTSTNTAVTAIITGLITNTTYHFRVTATNASGTVYGEDRTFTFTVPKFPWVMFMPKGRTCPAQPDYCYLVADGDNEGSRNSALLRYDFDDGGLVLLNRLGVDNVEAIALSPDGETLYTVDDGIFGFISTTAGSTNSFNPISNLQIGNGNGAIGVVNLDDIDGLAFDPNTDELFATARIRGQGGIANVLLKLDHHNGQLINNAFGTGNDYLLINAQAVGLTNVDDIAIDAEGIIYCAASESGSSGGDILGTINAQTGDVTVIGALSDGTSPTQDMEGLTFYHGNNLYGSTGVEFPEMGTDNSLYHIDSQTGTTERVIRLDQNFDGYIPNDFEAVACHPVCR